MSQNNVKGWQFFFLKCVHFKLVAKSCFLENRIKIFSLNLHVTFGQKRQECKNLTGF